MDLVEIAKADRERRGPDPIRVLAGTVLGAGAGRYVGGMGGSLKAAAGMSSKERQRIIRGGSRKVRQRDIDTARRGAAYGTAVGALGGGVLGAGG